MSEYCYIIINWSPYFIRISLAFTYVLLLFWELNQHITLHLVVMSPLTPWLSQFSDFSGFGWLWLVLRITELVFCRMPFRWIFFFNVFLMIRLGLCVFGWKDTEIKCHFHQIISSVHTYQHYVSGLMLTLITWLRLWFLHCKVYFSPFLYCYR